MEEKSKKIAIQANDAFIKSSGISEEDHCETANIMRGQFVTGYIIGYTDSTKISPNLFTEQEMKYEIRKAFVHGQGNKELMESGLERNEVEDYVLYSMARLIKKVEEDKKLNYHTELISLELAKQAKKEGFNLPTEYYWLDKNLPFVEKGIYKNKDEKLNNNSFEEYIYSAPTIKEYTKWKNETHNI